MVDVEQGALGALEQDIGALLAVVADAGGHIGHQRLQDLGEGQGLFQGLLEVDGLGLEVVLEHEVMVVEHLAQQGGEALAVEQVAQAQAATRDLVFVGGADAAAGGADGGLAAGLFAGMVQRDVVGHDEGAGLGQAQALAHRNALVLELGHFLEQGLGREHHAVADEAFHALAQDAGGDQVQDGLFVADDQGVAGVVPALEAHHRGGVLGEQIDDLALALVTPLGAQNDCEPGHGLDYLDWIGFDSERDHATGTTCQASP